MYSVLKKWGINISDSDWYPEYLLKNYPDKSFYIDKFPLSVENAHKFNQVDVFFQKVKGKALRDKFLLMEKKYINVLTKLWLYNQVFVGATIHMDEDFKKIDKKYVKGYQKLQLRLKQSGLAEITDKKELDYLIQLGTRDIAEIAFYCKEYELIIIPSWSCFIIYFNNLSKFKIVKDIVESEGMFLRMQ